MSDALVSRLEALGRSLRSRLRAWDLRVTPYREGVDCWVDLVELPHGATAVVRSAKMERQLTRYEGLVDFGVEVVKQVAVAGLLRDHGLVEHLAGPPRGRGCASLCPDLVRPDAGVRSGRSDGRAVTGAWGGWFLGQDTGYA